MERKTVGIVFGCFIPLHEGHMDIIRTALTENDETILGVTGYDMDRGRDFVPFLRQVRLMEEIYGENPDIILSEVDDRAIGLTGTFSVDAWRTWCRELFGNAGMDPRDPSIAYTWYTGEPDYTGKISAVYPEHGFRTADRKAIPLSGTMVRENPIKYRDRIHPPVLVLLAKEPYHIRRERRTNVMKLKPIVTSLLENDLYKYSMGQAIYHQFPKYETGWTVKVRDKDVRFTPEMVTEIREQIEAYCSLSYTEEELAYLSGIPWIDKSYVDFLRLWHPRFEDFRISNEDPCGLSIETDGTWLNTSQYEIPTLFIVCEVYFRMEYNYDSLIDDFRNRLDDKFVMLKRGDWYAGNFSEFGLRRRLSGEAQLMVVDKFSHLNDTAHSASRFVGTSNVYLAKECGIKPVGTMAHEWIMCVGQGCHKHNPAYSNWYALEAWAKEYGVLNGTALTDTITTDCFLRDFRLTYATLFSGVRHDSGDPYDWGDAMIDHYLALGIDPATKMLLFSDSLNFEKADRIFRYFNGKPKGYRPKVAFGIGTYLSNDTYAPPLNIVMKVTKCNGQDVAKLSDAEGKNMCKNPEYVDYLKRSINWRMGREHEKTGRYPSLSTSVLARRNDGKATIEIRRDTMDAIRRALDCSPLYDEYGKINERDLGKAIELMAELCAK